MKMGMLRTRSVAIAAGVFAYFSMALAPAYASDTEVYARKLSDPVALSPTLMMMLDTSGSMSYCIDTESSCSTESKKRITHLKSALNTILNGADSIPGNVKLGYTIFQSGSYGRVMYPARPLDAFVELNPEGVVTSTPAAGTDDAEQATDGSGFVSNSAELDFAYEDSNNKANYVGLRFPNVVIPKGATVTKAVITVTANKNGIDYLPVWEAAIEDTDDAKDYATSPTITGRSYLGTTSSQSMGKTWAVNNQYDIDVTNALDKLVNTRAGWCGGNAVNFRIKDVPTGTVYTRGAYSFEGSATSAPKLTVYWTVDPTKTDSCVYVDRTTAQKINNTFDDVTWFSSVMASEKSGSTNLPLRFAEITSSGRKNVGLYFRNLVLEQGSVVQSAELVLTGKNWVSGVPNIEVYVRDHDDAPAFCTSTSSCSAAPGVPGTMYSMAWTPPSSLPSDSKLRLDVAPIIQALLNRAGWTSGADVAIVMRSSKTSTSDSKSVGADSMETNSSNSAQLNIVARSKVRDLNKLLTVREDLTTQFNALTASGGTPLGAAYAESAAYMMGSNVYNSGSMDQTKISDLSKYDSPLSGGAQCAGNFIYLLTDGVPEPQNNYEAQASNNVLPSTNQCATGTSMPGRTWACANKLADYLVKGQNVKSSIVRTSTVNFGPGATEASNMKALAETYGGGRYFEAKNSADLVDSLRKTIQDLFNVSGTIAAPGVAVNQLNRLNHLDQVYYGVFQPEANKAFWQGNLKRYRLDIANSMILDADGKNAIDPATTFFQKNARSYWSPTADGSSALLGGSSNMLPAPASRTMYTYLGSESLTNQSLTKINLSDSTFVTNGKAALPALTSTEFTNLMNWYLGYDIGDDLSASVTVNSSTDLRTTMGAVLHSQPLLVNYGYTGSAAAASTDPSLQDNTVFFSTLEGTLHAVNANTGVEQFSFIPKTKFQRLNVLFANPNQEVPEMGMDLTWTAVRYDANGDRIIGTGDRVYLVGGMRMGGNNYYVLDVTNRTAPKLKFVLTGGSTGPFAKMGQTWSQPTVTSVKIGGVIKSVMVFGGGYDPDHENSGIFRTNDAVGNQLYMVDLETGNVIWWASNSGSAASGGAFTTVSDMKYSIPMTPKVVDKDGDGFADLIYFGDLGGQVFRVDVDEKNTAVGGLVKRVQTLAKLGETGPDGQVVTAQRRFFEQPTVAFFKDPATETLFTAVGMGTGYRSHPLDELTKDRFYVLFDTDAGRGDLLRTSSLATTTQEPDLVRLNMSAAAGAVTTGKRGWYVALDTESGEKVLSSGIIFQKRLLFTTYVPRVVGGDVCNPVVGRSKLYQMCMPFGSLCSDQTDRVTDNVVLGIGSSPQLVFNLSNAGTGKIGILTGTHPPIPGFSNTSPKLENMGRWRTKSR